jgi:hypothetical protein
MGLIGYGYPGGRNLLQSDNRIHVERVDNDKGRLTRSQFFNDRVGQKSDLSWCEGLPDWQRLFPGYGK